MTELTREAIAAIDKDDMLGVVLDQSNQLTDALWRFESASISRLDASGGLLVCGMGGSAIGADLAAAAIGSRAVRPIATVRDYALPPWFRGDSLVVCASYSGDTEETLACWEAAEAAGAPRVAVTTGGELARLAREAGVPVVSPPGGMLPRASVAYMTVAVLECAAAAGAAPRMRAEIEVASVLLAELAGEWGPDAPADSLAKALAAKLRGTLPLFYGSGPTVAVAARWKSQINENAKLPAFSGELPEADHNEICGFERSKALAPLAAVFLEDRDIHPRTQTRMQLTAELAQGGTKLVERVQSRGESPLDRVLSLVFLGDLVSVYMAALDGVDPSPMEAIEQLKDELAQP